MANAVALTAASAAAAISDIKLGGNSNGNNSAAWTFANGAPGAGDTIANAQLLVGVSTTSRLYQFLTTSFLTQLALDTEAAALGLIASVHGGTLFRLVTAGPGVPTATLTTGTATGSLRMSVAASQE